MTWPRQTQSDVLPLKHAGYNAQLFQTSLFSDCTVYSNDRVWHLHRCILSPRSEFFWKCFQGEFEEANNSMIEMHDDDPNALERLLKWLYTLEYPAMNRKAKASWVDDLILYMMADKYGLTELMDVTRQALLNEAAKCTAQSSRLVDTAEDFAEAMRIFYEDLPEREDISALRDALLQRLAPVIASNFRTVPIIQKLMADIPQFGIALMESLAQCQENRRVSSSSSDTLSITSRGSPVIRSSTSPEQSKVHIPLNEDSEDEFE